ncbi:MAG: septal ring lytic transglycosylase RlpA family protein [Prevotella sp.]|nr:septal ring lytic transglycosylase RlpA family protein [Prevotella sp.]
MTHLRHLTHRIVVTCLLLLSLHAATAALRLHSSHEEKGSTKATPSSVADQQKGKASFYSRRSNGARTSSGVRLNNDSLVCAHKSHPFGTLLLVKNPANGKEVVVKVIDRGPHVRGRIIDLSYEAARRLGIIAAGVAMVEVSVYEPDLQIPMRPKEPSLPELELEITTPKEKGILKLEY